MATVEKILALPEARDLCNLSGIAVDLKGARDCASRLLELHHANSRDKVLVEALSTGVLVKYCRALGHGGGRRGKVDVSRVFSSTEMTSHSQFVDMRSKHIAHSVNVFEENVFSVQIETTPPAAGRVVDVSVQHRSVIGLSPEDTRTLLDLIQKIERSIEERIGLERSRLIKLVQSHPHLPGMDSPKSQFSSHTRHASKHRKE